MEAERSRPVSMPPPPTSGDVPRLEEKGKRKAKASTSEKAPKKKARKVPAKIDTSQAVVSSRWKTVTDTHHTRLVDLIKLYDQSFLIPSRFLYKFEFGTNDLSCRKLGEEDEFEAESAGNRLQADYVGRKSKKTFRNGSRGAPAQRLSLLKGNHGRIYLNIYLSFFFCG